MGNRAPLPERVIDGLPKSSSVEGETEGERGYVPNVLDAGVARTEARHGMELLGHRRLARGRPDVRHRMVQ